MKKAAETMEQTIISAVSSIYSSIFAGMDSYGIPAKVFRIVKDDFRSHARYGHANLAYGLASLPTHQKQISPGSLQSGALPICQRSRLGPMVDMSTASAAAGYSISRLLRIKPLIICLSSLR